jgi:hypothetical protein
VGNSADSDGLITWEDELAPTQQPWERLVLFVIPLAMALISVIGIVLALGVHPRTTFDAGSITSFIGILYLVGLMYACLWIAYRNSWMVRGHSHQRFIPATVTVGVNLLLVWFLQWLALGSADSFDSSLRAALLGGLVFMSGFFALVWTGVVLTRSLLARGWKDQYYEKMK